MSAFVCPLAITLITQRLKDLSEIDEDYEGLVQVALQKRIIAALVALAPKRAKKVQPVSKPRASVILSVIPRRIKT